MKCSECGGKGFKEYEGGVIQVKCAECGGTGEVGYSQEYLSTYFTGELPNPDSCYVLPSKGMALGKNEPIIPLSKMGEVKSVAHASNNFLETERKVEQVGGLISEPATGIVSRIEPDNQPTRSPNPGKSKQSKKQKKRKSSTKRPRKTV